MPKNASVLCDGLFFHAEDGIRDHCVTGVQTCALPILPPELREGSGELEAAANGGLPLLVEQGDLRGLLHCHSNYSDGTVTIADWAAACRAAGYAWVGITDHSKSSPYAGGLATEDVAQP